MTREQKIEAFAMRLDGETLQAIGDYFGVSKQYVADMLSKGNSAVYRSGLKSIAYPNIAAWMKAEGISKNSFAEMCNTTAMTMNRALRGDGNPSKKLIDDILRATGLTYEEAFSMGENGRRGIG